MQAIILSSGLATRFSVERDTSHIYQIFGRCERMQVGPILGFQNNWYTRGGISKKEFYDESRHLPGV